MTAFELDPQLAADTHFIADLPLCRLLLMDDSRYPWCILVPRRAGLRELHGLPRTERLQLLGESEALSCALEALFRPDKLNLAALGNVVAQLHLHHVARYRHDPVWPKPVWGQLERLPYAPREAAERVERIGAAVAGLLADPPAGPQN